MFKIIILLITFLFFTYENLIAAGSSSSGSSSNTTNVMTEYDWAERKILKGKKLEQKGKENKAKEYYKDALKNLKKANKDDPANPDVYSYMGFVERKLGNFKDAEILYLIGLEINPKHIGINEYLGELYAFTDRINQAKERLEVLRNCNCEEFQELKEIIDGTLKSKY